MPNKRLRVGVIGSGIESHAPLSVPLAQWLAGQDCDVINGGGGGVMAAVSKAFAEHSGRKGRVIGILPAAEPCDSSGARTNYSPAPGYPNAWVDIPIYTHLHLSGASGKNLASRNHIIILSADVIVAFPGGEGTHSEIQLALEYGQPLLILNPGGEWDEFKNSGASLVKNPEEAIEWLNKNFFQAK